MRKMVPGKVECIISDKAVVFFRHGPHTGQVEIPACDFQAGDEIEIEVADMAFPDPGAPPISMGWRPSGYIKVEDETYVGGLKGLK